jgi:para-aminobenzoate synthetase component I
MKLLQTLPWIEPLDLASAIATGNDRHWILLYSASKTSYSGRYSILAYDMKRIIQGDDFNALDRVLTSDKPCFSNAWFGALSYGLKNALESLTTDEKNWLHLPALCMVQYNTIVRFDHQQRSIELWSEHPNSTLPTAQPHADTYPIEVSSISSNMSKTTYLNKVQTIIDSIHNGDLYQANLTRKFNGTLTETPPAFEIFRQLCQKSPAPYSAFIKMDDTYVLSSSPELFLNIEALGHIRTRPIKGTTPRHTDKRKDETSRRTLETSEKDRAENLMIVDLMRNDLARSCITGSVSAPDLFEITSHTNVHHLSSTITGQKRDNCSTLDAIKHCFPPGSMTGAPKIKAMQLCSELEKVERGLYSGAIGTLGGDGSAELSVVIRTLLMRGNQFEFQVGGGIVADSIPEQEFKETIDKARGILSCLNLNAASIEAL